MAMAATPCAFCDSPGGEVLWQDDFCRVVRPEEPGYPGFCRVILGRHAREMTDLSRDERVRLMDVVFTVEQAVREAMTPEKMNVASLGNMVPHVHWHVVPRFHDDPHFPTPPWGPQQREARMPQDRQERASRIATLLSGRLGH